MIHCLITFCSLCANLYTIQRGHSVRFNVSNCGDLTKFCKVSLCEMLSKLVKVDLNKLAEFKLQNL